MAADAFTPLDSQVQAQYFEQSRNVTEWLLSNQKDYRFPDDMLHLCNTYSRQRLKWVIVSITLSYPTLLGFFAEPNGRLYNLHIIIDVSAITVFNPYFCLVKLEPHMAD